jgi:hypothetical protein
MLLEFFCSGNQLAREALKKHWQQNPYHAEQNRTDEQRTEHEGGDVHDGDGWSMMRAQQNRTEENL